MGKKTELTKEQLEICLLGVTVALLSASELIESLVDDRDYCNAETDRMALELAKEIKQGAIDIKSRFK